MGRSAPEEPLFTMTSTGSDTEETIDIVDKMAEHENLREWVKGILDAAKEAKEQFERMENDLTNELGTKSLEEVSDSVTRASTMLDPCFSVAAFRTVIAWIQHDPPNRAIYLETLMENLDFGKVDLGDGKLLDKEFEQEGILSESSLCYRMYCQVVKKRVQPLISEDNSVSNDKECQQSNREPMDIIPRSTVSLVLRAFSEELKMLTDEESPDIQTIAHCSPSMTPASPPRSRISELLRSFSQSFKHMQCIKSNPQPIISDLVAYYSYKRPSDLRLEDHRNKVCKLEGTGGNSGTSSEYGDEASLETTFSNGTDLDGRAFNKGGDHLIPSQAVVLNQDWDENGGSSPHFLPKVPKTSSRHGPMRTTSRNQEEHVQFRTLRSLVSHIIGNAVLKGRPYLFSYNSETRKRQPLSEVTVFRKYSSKVVAGGCLYDIGGVLASKQPIFTDGKYGVDLVDIYTLGGKCQKREGPKMLDKRKEAAAVVHGDFIYMIGGAHPNALLSACEVLNWTLPEETAKWEKLPDYMHVPRSGHAVVILNNEMYAIGGIGTELTTFESVEKYNFVTETWNLVRPLLESRARAGVAVMNGKIYVVGGLTTREKRAYEYDRLNSVEVYDPSFNIWLPIAQMKVKRRGSLVVVRDGRLVVIGGNAGPASMEVYDPLTDQWKYNCSKHPFGPRKLLRNMRGSGFEGAVEARL